MPEVPVSWGELVDKIAILEIKQERLTDPAALANVRRELASLRRWEAETVANGRLGELKTSLAQVNRALWDVEDAIRSKEARAEFDDEFIALARSVYRQNDRRAALKREINLALASELIEEKSYPAYREP
jgi:transcriptional regulator of nitric oxide reductase